MIYVVRPIARDYDAFLKEPEYFRVRRYLIVIRNIVDNFLTVLASECSKKQIPHLINVEYASKDTWTMDVFGTTLPIDSPVFVYIHGGYWQCLNKDISSYVVEPFFKAGITVIIPEYELAPKATVENIVEQIKSMSHRVLSDAVSRGSRSVWFGGHSAGAQLAASLLDEKWYMSLDESFKNIFKGLVLISGLFDLTPIIYTDNNKSLHLNKKRAQELSPLHKKLEWTNNIKGSFTVLLAVAENDSPAFHAQTLAYKEHLKNYNIRTDYTFLEGLDHFDIVEKLGDENYILTENIILYIKELD